MTEDNSTPQKRQFLGIWFDCCGTYGRIYKIVQEQPMSEDVRDVYALFELELAEKGQTEDFLEAVRVINNCF